MFRRFEKCKYELTARNRFENFECLILRKRYILLNVLILTSGKKTNTYHRPLKQIIHFQIILDGIISLYFVVNTLILWQRKQQYTVIAECLNESQLTNRFVIKYYYYNRFLNDICVLNDAALVKYILIVLSNIIQLARH